MKGNATYKIHISSANALAGDWRDGIYNIDLPVVSLGDQHQWQIAVESFVVNNAVTIPYLVVSPTLPIMNAPYSTFLGGPLNVILTGQGSVNRCDVNTSFVGLKITNPLLLRNTNIVVQLYSVSGVLLASNAFGASAVWSMTLVVY